MRNHVELSPRARKDLDRLERKDVERIAKTLFDDLAAEPAPSNLEIKPVVGHRPWLELKIPPWRVLFRPMTPSEMRELRILSPTGPRGLLIGRVVRRADLERAVKTLPTVR
jgi:mRNA-degrading endonuclease RelE of RelBE toxin-antitoxin system